MALEYAVLHSLTRSDYAGPIKVKKSESICEVDGPILSVFEQAKKQLNCSASKRFGYFDPEGENKTLASFLQKQQNEAIDFLSLSQKLLAQCELSFDLSDTPIATTLLVAIDRVLEQHYFYVFMLANEEVTQLGPDLQPFYSQSVNASKVSFAIRIHIESWLEDDSPKYLTQILSRGAKDLSSSFEHFSNFKEGIDVGAQTKEFLSLVEDYSDKLDDEQAKSFKKEVVDYCVDQDKVGIPIMLDELSEQFAEKNDDFVDFVTSHQQQPTKEIHTDRSTLKRYMRYFGRDTSLSISFNAERFGKDIQYSPAEGSLTIHKLPKTLKMQLSGHNSKVEDT